MRRRQMRSPTTTQDRVFPQSSLLPADSFLELLELVFLHIDRVLLARVNAPLDLVAVIRQPLFYDRNEIAIDLGVARRVFLVGGEQVRADNVYSVRRIPRTE